MTIDGIAHAIATFGIIPVVIGFIIFFILWTRKSDNETKKHYRSLLDEHRAESKTRNERIMEILVRTHSGVNSVKENTKLHTKDEEKEGVRISTSINAWLKRLIKDTRANRAVHMLFHNGAKDVTGRGLPKLSIMHEQFDSWSTPIMGDIQNYPRSFFPFALSSIESPGYYYINDIEMIKELEPTTYHFFKPRGVKSFIAQSIQSLDKRTLGFILLEFNADTDCESDKTIQKSIRSAATRIGAALEIKGS